MYRYTCREEAIAISTRELFLEFALDAICKVDKAIDVGCAFLWPGRWDDGHARDDDDEAT